MRGCPNCGRMVDSNYQRCPFCDYDFSCIDEKIKRYEKSNMKTMPKYAGFIKRTVASSIDNFIFSLVFAFLNFVYLFAVSPSKSMFFGVNNFKEYIELFWPMLLMPVFYFVYCILMQYSKNMGTLGEKLVGIEVVDADDNPITLKQAFLRNLFRLFNILTLGIGYIMIIFTKKKQALSDILSNTLVNNRVIDEKINVNLYANPVIRYIAYVLDMIFLYVFYVLVNILFVRLTVVPLDVTSGFYLFIPLIVILFMLLYFPFMESKSGATFGKMIMGLKVTDYDGNKIGFFRALFRYLCLFVQSFVLLSPFLCFTTHKKQNLNDILSGTLVVNKR